MLNKGIPARLRPKTPASASVTSRLAYVPTPTAQAAQGTPPAAPIAAGTFAATPDPNAGPDPAAAAKAAYQQALAPIQNAANAQYGATVLNAGADETTYAQRAGANIGSRDGLADSAVTPFSFDWQNVETNNPFSQAALLQRSWREQQARTTNGLAAQGQLYSTAMQSQKGSDLFGYQQGQNSLAQGVQDALVAAARQRQQAGVDRDTTVAQGGLTALQTLLGGS